MMVTHDNELAKRTARTVVIADGQIVNDSVRNGKKPRKAIIVDEQYLARSERSIVSLKVRPEMKPAC
jgi:ABC-type lipoprotein export system ATPase subunit